VQIVPNKEGGRNDPSVLFTDKGERLVAEAKRQAVTNAANTSTRKRLIGRKYNSAEVQKMRETAAFEIVDSPNGDAACRAGPRL